MTGRIFKFFLGTPLKLWASVGHWAIWHFNINKFSQKQRPRVRHRVIAVCGAAACISARQPCGTRALASARVDLAVIAVTLSSTAGPIDLTNESACEPNESAGEGLGAQHGHNTRRRCT